MKKALKIGVLLPQSAVYPSISSNLLTAIELYMEEQGWQAGGREVKLIPQEVDLNSKVVPDRVHRLMSIERVDMMIGCIGAHAMGLCRDIVVGQGIPLIVTTPGASVQKECQTGACLFRNTLGLWQSNCAMSAWGVKEFGKRAMLALILLDAGYDSNFSLHQGVHSEGGEVSRWHMSDGSDFVLEMEPVIAGAREVKPDFIFVNACGGKAVGIIKAFSESGVMKDVPLIGSAFALEEPNLSELGETALGIKSAHGWANGLKHEEHIRFCREFEEFAEAPAEGFAALGYESARMACDAIDAVGGDMKRKEDVLVALNGMDFVGPRGRVRMDPATRTMAGPLHLREVQAVGGGFENVAIGELPGLLESDEIMNEVRGAEQMQWTNEYLCI
jgi:branched-chain amino acid transport system substrate-binding protein